MKKVQILALVVVLASCVSSTRSGAPAAASASTTCRDTHEQLQTALWMQTAAEYRMITESVYRAATLALETALADGDWTAAVEQAGEVGTLPPAVVLDLDETVLDNSRLEGEEVLRRQPYTRELWHEWVRLRKAELVPGAKAFLDAAQRRGVAVFFITNRAAGDETDTVANLLALGIDASPENTMCVGESGWTSDKTARRALVAQSHRVLLLVGDDLGDFIPSRLPAAERVAAAERQSAWWGSRWFVLPNPMYGSWERALWNHESGLTDAQMLERKISVIKGFRN